MLVDSDYINQLFDILEGSAYYFADIRPSDWFEQNMVMPQGSAFPGPFKYNLTPYWREVVDCMAKDHPAKIIAVMKGAQTGCSASVLTPAVGYTISQNPGNILFLTGHSDLSDEAMLKLDYMIDNCGLRPLIRPQVLRAKNARSGDTAKSKEFPGGTLIAGSASNEKLLRQRDIMVCIADDIDAAKTNSKAAGSTRSMIEQRLAAYYHKMKLYYVSTPELKENSNIEPAFLLGDQRYYYIPCPCCGDFINLQWTTTVEGKENEPAGITYALDDKGKVIKDSVGYTCQKCGGFFDDSNKMELLNHGVWKPTAEASKEGYYSYHLSSLYAPHGMYDWEYYARQFVEANPIGQPQKEELHKAFLNLCLGVTFEPAGESIEIGALQKNIREYYPGTIPETLSIKEGNGKIVLLTCAADLNGKLDDARLDYEIVAWSESGTSYSILHGSVGTFIPFSSHKENKGDREVWTYENTRPNNVWKEFDAILKTVFDTDTGRKMKVAITGIDTGYCELQAFTYIEATNNHVVGIKGDKIDRHSRDDADLKRFKVGASRSNLFILRVNEIKDDLAYHIKLKWNKNLDEKQPPGFMNFPMPQGTMYQTSNYFEHFEAEHKVYDRNNNYIWVKKTQTSQNHLLDCRVYNLALKDIWIFMIAREMKIKDFGWSDYCSMVIKS